VKIPNPSRSAANTSLRRLFRRRRPGRILTTPVVLALKTARRRRRSKMPAPIENRPPEQRRIRLRILLQILFLVSESFLVQFDSLSFPPRGRRGVVAILFAVVILSQETLAELLRSFASGTSVSFRHFLSLRCFRGLLQGAMSGTFRLSRLLLSPLNPSHLKYHDDGFIVRVV
jgi:hypothetical protein